MLNSAAGAESVSGNAALPGGKLERRSVNQVALLRKRDNDMGNTGGHEGANDVEEQGAVLSWPALCIRPTFTPLNNAFPSYGSLRQLAATQADNLLGRSVASDVSRAGNVIGLQFIPIPAAQTVGRMAGTMQGPLLPRSLDDWLQVRAIWVGAKAHKVAGQALRAFNAMTDAPSHNRHHKTV